MLRWVLSLLSHPEEEIRAAALELLRDAVLHVGPTRAHQAFAAILPVVRSVTRDPSRQVRRLAVELLGLLRDRRAYQRLLDALADPSPVVRGAAVQAIARAVTLVPDAPTTWAVCQALWDPSPAVRVAVLRALRGSPRACPLGRVTRLLGDASRLWLRLRTQARGDLGLLASGEQVRAAALQALPASLREAGADRAPADSPRPLAAQIAEVRRALSRLGLPAGPLPWPPLRPRPPRGLGGPDRPEPGRNMAEETLLRRLLALAARGTGRSAAEELRLRLQSPAARAAFGALLPRLHEARLDRALGAIRGLPLEGGLLRGVVRLLGSRAAARRAQALSLLRDGTRDDLKWPVLERALWLAREDPSARVRAAALHLLATWHAGRAVLLRLAHALCDPAGQVRAQAAESLFELCSDWYRAVPKSRPPRGQPAGVAATRHARGRAPTVASQPGARGKAAAVPAEGSLCLAARRLVLARLPGEPASVRGVWLALLIRGPGALPPVAWVIQALESTRQSVRQSTRQSVRRSPRQSTWQSVRQSARQESRLPWPVGPGRTRAVRTRAGPAVGSLRGSPPELGPGWLAVLLALESRFGMRHRGPEADRAARWQDELRRAGWRGVKRSPSDR